jgi:hypothetical protein
MPLPKSESRRRLITASQQHYHHLHRSLKDQLAVLDNEELRNVNVAQNVIRDCITAVLIEMMPYSHLTPLELAQRLASYVLSTVPIEDQDAVVAAHVTSFADFHMERTAGGNIIAAAWKMEDGTEKPAFPEN